MSNALNKDRSEALRRFMRRKKVSVTLVAGELHMPERTLNEHLSDILQLRYSEMIAIASRCNVSVTTLVKKFNLPSEELAKPDTGYDWMIDNQKLIAENKRLNKDLEIASHGTKAHIKELLKSRENYLKRDGHLGGWKARYKDWL